MSCLSIFIYGSNPAFQERVQPALKQMTEMQIRPSMHFFSLYQHIVQKYTCLQANARIYGWCAALLSNRKNALI